MAIKYEKWIISAFIAIIAFFVLCLIRSNANLDNARYILSAISQGFAAIFALVFTITLIVAQLTGSYAIILKKEKEFIFLMIIFGIGIIIPLIILNLGFWFIGVNGAIAFSIFCIAALIQHFAGIINEELKYAWIEKLPGEVEDSIDSQNIPRASVKIEELGMLGKDVARKRVEDQAISVIRGLQRAGLKAIEGGKEFGDIVYTSIYELYGVGLEAARKKLDAQKARELFSDIIGFTVVTFSATASALNALKDVGTKAAKADMGDATFSAMEYLGEVGIVAMENGLNQDTINEAVLGLEEVGKESAEKRLTYSGNFVVVQVMEKLMEFGNKAIKHKYETELIVNVLWVLSAASTKYSVDFDITIRVIQFVRNIPSEASTIVALFEKGFDNGRRYVDEKFPDLVDSLREFKKRYEER
jgi:hypothetical protein